MKLSASTQTVVDNSRWVVAGEERGKKKWSDENVQMGESSMKIRRVVDG
jgi:hypothetical protein